VKWSAKDEILTAVWDYEFAKETRNIVEVYIGRLRGASSRQHAPTHPSRRCAAPATALAGGT
jgi:DNA-binding response OmpR family regulator